MSCEQAHNGRYCGGTLHTYWVPDGEHVKVIQECTKCFCKLDRGSYIQNTPARSEQERLRRKRR